MSLLRTAILSVSVGLIFVVASTRAEAAGVKPGDVITARNAARVRGLVSPGVYYAVRHDMRMNVVATRRIDFPPPYREATEQYSSQVRLSKDHRSLQGYVAGQPFPLLDPNDPYVATKIMWNQVFRPISSDDYDLRFFECEHQYLNPGGGQFMVEYTQTGHYAGYNLIGRTEVEPLPTDPDFKTTGRMWLFAFYPLLAPQSGRGSGLLRYRYADPKRDDDIWAYSPSSRRLRRLDSNTMTSSTSPAVQTTNYDIDHFSGFNAKLEYYDYKLLGEKNMLASVHARHSPAVTCPYDGGGTICPEDWEMRHLYVVEVTPRRGIGVDAVAGMTVAYVDSEMWVFPYVDTYDRAGQLYQIQIFWLTYRDRPVPDARVAIYPFKREFIVAMDRIDTQSGFTDVCYLPGKHTPERECWYINMGAVDKEFCTTMAMVRAGH